MFKKIKPYLLGIAIPVAVGGLAAFLTRNSMDLYTTIVQPPLAPPAILFPIVWTVLYILMGIGATIVYTSDAESEKKTDALVFYSLQLTVNFFWSIFFFNDRAFLLSFVWLLLLLALIIAMIISFAKADKTAAWLQVPYLVWVTFAGYLNLAIYLLNR